MTKEIITGLHIVGQIHTGPNNNKSTQTSAFRSFLSGVLVKHNFKELGSSYHSFGEEEGFTGVVCLAESHVAIHTWPEHDYITLDVFLCNYSRNNEDICRAVFDEICEYFQPKRVDKQEIIR